MNKITNKELIKVWSKVAAQSFGGPAGQIAVIHKLVVEEKKIINEEKFLRALNFCMLLPGPEAQQLATYMGWLMRGWFGGLVAGGLFILPGFLSILALSYLYVLYSDLSIVQGLFYGLKPAIIAIVLAALYRISQKALNSKFYWIIAGASFIALFFFNLPFPLVVISAGILGALHGIRKINDDSIIKIARPSFKQLFKTMSVWIFIWILPIVLIYLIWGANSNFHTLNLFFSKMSLVTFGGAYAALSYVAQQAVEIYHWLAPGEMLDGLALAETTPGPLIQVVQFVGFMGAYRFSDPITPLWGGFIGSVLTTWMTFAPCFLFIFSFAPFVEYIQNKKHFNYALKSITAAVVGVIFNLSVWFVLQSLFKESAFDYKAGFICALACFMQFKLKAGLFTILGVSTFLGIILVRFS